MSIFSAKIILATDGSKEAEYAASVATALAESTDSELHVVLVEELPYAYDAPAVSSPASGFFIEVHKRARRQLDAELEKVRSVGGRNAEAHLRVGTAAREIVALAEEIGAGLIVIGSGGLGIVRRALMGSVSLSTVHHAHCSVLIVRGSGHQEEERYVPGRVLLAYDGSKEASAAAKVAAEITNVTGSQLHFLHVVANEPYSPPFDYVSYEAPEVWEAWKASLEGDEERARSFVEGEAQRMEAQGAKVAEAHLSFGRPEEDSRRERLAFR